MNGYSDWVFCVAIDAPGLIFSHDPWCFGQFELTRHPDPLPGCEEALQASATDLAVALSTSQLRAKTFFLDSTREDTQRFGALHVRETLDLFALAHIMVRPRPLEAGYLFDLRQSKAYPFLQSPQRATAKMMGTVALLDERATRNEQVLTSLLSSDPSKFGELGAALRRSTHWARLAREAVDRGERLMMFWMAAETLSRVEESELLTSKFAAAAGFPSSQYDQSLEATDKTQRDGLRALSDFKTWQTRLKKLFEDLRDARNAVAHSGYRELEMAEFFSDTELRILGAAMPTVVSSLQSMAVNGLAIGLRTIGEMWERYGECIRAGSSVPLATWVGGTVMYFLQEAETGT